MVLCSAVGNGKYRVEGIAIACGMDINVSVFGGERPHIGAVSLAEYEQGSNTSSVNTISIASHKDDYIASEMAKRLSVSSQCTVVVSCGIHIDDASAEDLKILINNCKQLTVQLDEKLHK